MAAIREVSDAQASGVRKLLRAADSMLLTEAEVTDHELAHLRYRSWCRHCVRGAENRAEFTWE